MVSCPHSLCLCHKLAASAVTATTAVVSAGTQTSSIYMTSVCNAISCCVSNLFIVIIILSDRIVLHSFGRLSECLLNDFALMFHFEAGLRCQVNVSGILNSKRFVNSR